jgi:hypothetical protein
MTHISIGFYRVSWFGVDCVVCGCFGMDSDGLGWSVAVFVHVWWFGSIWGHLERSGGVCGGLYGLPCSVSVCHDLLGLMVYRIGVLPLRELHERCAAANGLCGSAGIRWSAVNGSLVRLPSPHIQQCVAVSRMCFARFG